MELQVFTRSNNDTLYEMMREFIPPHISCSRMTGFDHWEQANDYLFSILDIGKEWIINIDEDAFVINWNCIENMIKYMSENRIEYAGMCDGGVCPHRSRSWVIANPFFNIFNAKSIREKIRSVRREYINSRKYQMWMEAKKPDFLKSNVNHDDTEPFTGLFYWLMNVSKGLYLNATTHSDKFSTLLHDSDGEIFLYHTWMSREFNAVGTQKDRIMRIYDEAKIEKNN